MKTHKKNKWGKKNNFFYAFDGKMRVKSGNFIYSAVQKFLKNHLLDFNETWYKFYT